MIVVIWSGRDTECGCFSSRLGQPVNWFTLGRSALLGTFIVLLLYMRKYCAWDPTLNLLSWDERVAVGAVLLCLWVLATQSHTGMNLIEIRKHMGEAKGVS